jgi:hypothetical protein
MMPTVKSSTTVRPKVAISTEPVRQSRSKSRNSFLSAMFQATTIKRPARAESGMKLAKGAATSNENQKETGMQHSANRTNCPGADVGGRARDGSRDADSTKQGRGNVRDALNHEKGLVARADEPTKTIVP